MDLIEGLEADALLADKAYDADHLIEREKQNDTGIIILSKQNRKIECQYDEHLYKEQNIIERFFNKLKQFRLIATRYNKLLAKLWDSSNSQLSQSGSNR